MTGILLCECCKWDMEETLLLDPDGDVPDVEPAVFAVRVEGGSIACCKRHYRAALRRRAKYAIAASQPLEAPEVH